MTLLVACLLVCGLVFLLVLLALFRFGDVKAILKVPFLAFTLEAKDKTKAQ